MRHMSTETQESRRDTVAAAVTAQEKWQMQLVAKKQNRPLSDLMREHSLTDLIEMGRRLDEALNAITESAA
jgi:hypothetical protein